MVKRERRTEQAVAEAASLEAARAAAGAPDRRGGPGTSDPLVGELRRAGLLRVLVLRFCTDGACYGNQLIERISDLTGGLVAVNPNTMYPMLRALEAEGLLAGEWEHPERRSRRFYRTTEAGEAEAGELAGRVGEQLDAVAGSIEAIRAELG